MAAIASLVCCADVSVGLASVDVGLASVAGVTGTGGQAMALHAGCPATSSGLRLNSPPTTSASSADQRLDRSDASLLLASESRGARRGTPPPDAATRPPPVSLATPVNVRVGLVAGATWSQAWFTS